RMGTDLARDDWISPFRLRRHTGEDTIQRQEARGPAAAPCVHFDVHFDVPVTPRLQPDTRAATGDAVTKKILVIVSEFGYWGEELVGPISKFDERGYEVVFATPHGKKPGPLPPSVDPEFIDPPLGRPVTTPEVAKMVRDIDDSDRLAHPLSLADWIP